MPAQQTMSPEQFDLVYNAERERIEQERQRNVLEAERLALARAEIMGKTPGFLIDEVREAIGLGPHPDEDIGSLTTGVKSEE